MASQKERTVLFLTWQESCSKKRGCWNSFGRKLWRVQLTCSTSARRSKWRARLLKRHGAVTCLMSHTYKFLDVDMLHMLKYLKLKGRSLTIMMKNAFSSDIEESKAYKFYNPLTKKLVVSRDIIFNEAEAWSWSNKETVKEQPWWMNLTNPAGGSTTRYITISSTCYTVSCKRFSIFWGR